MHNRFERCLIEQCAPTLAGIKPGSLFNYTSEIGEDIHEPILGWNKSLGPKGLSVCLIKERSCGGLVYVYRSAMLSKHYIRMSAAFWETGDFHAATRRVCIEELRRRFRDEAGFPHEIGFFWVIPFGMLGFIENKGDNFSLCGMWKVYDDKTLAEKLFAMQERVDSHMANEEIKNAYRTLGRGFL